MSNKSEWQKANAESCEPLTLAYPVERVKLTGKDED